jgi:septum formation protein
MAEPGSASKLILASASPFRRRLLEAAGLTFRTVPAAVDEAALKRTFAAKTPKASPAEIAECLARAKAEVVSAVFPDANVIGADQVLALRGELFDKPGDLAEARAQLERLRGKTHHLFTAVALSLGGDVVWSHIEEATLTMRRFSRGFLDAYLAKAGEELCQIVGAYEIEGPGIQLFERIDGDHLNIIGLPMIPLLSELRSRGVITA